jgi:L,D-transpeptidase ErfK/SrfK
MRASVGACALAVVLLGRAAVSTREPVALSETTIGGRFAYAVEQGDTITALGARFGIDGAVIARENGLAPNAILRAGQRLTLDNRHIVPSGDAEILINVPQRMLFHRSECLGIRGYPIAVGRRDWPTPRGAFQVVAMEQNPIWDVPPSIQEESRRLGHPVITQMPPGPANPLGEFWLGLSLPGIGIHGTSAPTSIYRAATHGCIRLNPDDARELFVSVSSGTTGRIVYEPVLLAIVGDVVFLEAHKDVYRLATGDSLAATQRTLAEMEFGGSIDWNLARDVLRRRDGIARDIGCSAGSPQQADERGHADAARGDKAGRRDPGQNPR